MNARFHYRALLIIAGLIWLAPLLSAQDGLKGALSQTNLGTQLGQTLAIADLDGDHQADGAILMRSERVGAYSRIKIELHFTGRPNTELNFESGGQALTIRAWDIDHDGDNDLVVEDAFTHKPVRVWINEGNGDFHEGNVQDYASLGLVCDKQLLPPSTPGGCVAALPPSQHSLELSFLTVHVLGRPPSKGRLLSVARDFRLTSSVHTSYLSRAPPLFS